MHMTMLQIRNVPEDLHRRLKARAALQGMSLSDFALAELRRGIERPTRAELIERLEARPSRRLRTSPTDAIRRDRDDRARR
jgi:plasmid stability protein